MSISVIFEDHALLVLDKPSGLLSVPGKGEGKQDCLSARVQPKMGCAALVAAIEAAGSEVVMGEADEVGPVIWATGVAGLLASAPGFLFF